MNSRTIKKIACNPNHPWHKRIRKEFNQWVEAYARGECRRYKVPESQWGSITLRWPPQHGRLVGWFSIAEMKRSHTV